MDDLRRLLKADAARFSAWGTLLDRHPDTPVAVVDAILTRRGILASRKKSAPCCVCTAHNTKQAEATAEWAAGHRTDRPGVIDNVFAEALAYANTYTRTMPGLMSRLNKH